MRQFKTSVLVSLTSIFLTGAVYADSLTLSSNDIAHGEFMSKAQEFKGFGCDGGNVSPQLSWSGAPEGTQAFAVFVYDPDAPTGSGWWHWQIVNIPADVNSLPAGAGTPGSGSIPQGSIQIDNDYGTKGFGGACTPKKNGAHRYQFTVHALSQKLELPENASGALTGYMVNAHSLASSTIQALYKRD
ncbi:MAG: YbhB/YbcL family Raf kinase inhibitor-like protein [Oceanospirillales bacterium]|nr:YbhB/YbcL family Raf kinase inhibitor-like protein [Oceanospirillales bacterium]